MRAPNLAICERHDMFTLGSAVVAWSSKTQPKMALSSTKAEYRDVGSLGRPSGKVQEGEKTKGWSRPVKKIGGAVT